MTAIKKVEYANFSTNPNRYTERFLEFMPNGGVRRLHRHGLKADAYYGKVDNMHISYDGNRITTILEDTDPVTKNGTSVTFHYYTQDYLGNNRAVINGSTGAIEQTIAYYPFGGVIADLGTSLSRQQYKFGGKELITANGLNEYDFGARWYYSAFPGFTKPDPMAEKYPWLSPYLYCANNPVNMIDPTGKEWRPTINSNGDYVDFTWVESKDALDDNGKLLEYHYKQAILFSAEGEDGKTFDKDNKFNIGTSKATVYKADGTTEDFDACTYPSDVEKYATVPEGHHEAKVGLHRNKYVALRLSDIDTKNFDANSIELGKPNPAHPNTTKAVGVNIHKPGINNLTGLTSKGQAISQACLLIDINKWDEFIGIFNTPQQKNNKIGVVIQR